MDNKIKVELEQNKLRLEYYKARADQQPNQIHKKWVEIYADRVKRLEKQLTKVQSKTQRSATH